MAVQQKKRRLFWCIVTTLVCSSCLYVYILLHFFDTVTRDRLLGQSASIVNMVESTLREKIRALEYLAKFVATYDNPSDPQLRALLERTSDIDEDWRVNISDSTGRSLTSEGKEIKTDERSYFKTAIQGRPTVSGPYISPFTGQCSTVVAVPVQREGKVVGVLRSTIRCTASTRFLNNLRYTPDVTVYLTTPEGKVLWDTGGLRENMFDALKSGSDENGRAFIETMRRDILDGKDGSVTLTLNGGTHIVAFTRLYTGEYVVVYMPKNFVLDNFRQITMLTGVYLLLVALCFGLLIRQLFVQKERLKELVQEYTREWRQQASLLRHIFDALPQRIYYKSLDGVYEGCNRAEERFFDLPESEIIGRSDDDLFASDPGIVASSWALAARAIATCKPERSEEVVRCPDGTEQVFESYLSVYGPNPDEPMGLIGISQDITLRKHTEKAMEAARAAAVAASQAKTDFLANMSHEIRTPMNGILGLTHLLLRTPELLPEVRERLNKIDASARCLMNLLGNILDLSKIEASRLVINSTECELNLILVHVRDIIHGQAADKHLDFILDMSPHLPPVIVADSLRLTQVLLNLCNNAVKFTDEGAVRLRVWTTDENTQPRLCFEVSDTGTGIPANKLDTVFELFTQVDSSVARRFGGSGLGLTICRQLAELMGGDITVRSVPGKGSTFTLRVPLVLPSRDSAPAPQPIGAAESAYNESPADVLAGKRVLVVEDNSINQEIAVALLEARAMLPAVAENGELAVRMAEEEHYDLILMDIQMPVMDGIEAAERMRASSNVHLHTVPILAMTAHSTAGDREKTLAAGMNDHVTKPLDVDVLYTVMAYWLRNDTP